MYSQLRAYPEIGPYLVCRRIRVVHLVRRNYLDVLISSALKAKLGQAHFLDGQPRPEDPRVEIETQGLVECLKWKENKYRSMRSLLRWSTLPHIEVAYEDLVRDPSHFDDVWSFLAIDSQGRTAESQIQKTRQKGQLETLTNFPEVQQALAGTRYAELVEAGS
jgi:LPS sulfotransferase NodH